MWKACKTSVLHLGGGNAVNMAGNHKCEKTSLLHLDGKRVKMKKIKSLSLNNFI